MFSMSAVSISRHHRASPAHFLSEMIATAGLILVIFSLARTRRSTITPAAVGAYIGAAYFFTSSASFANPAITIGRMFSNTFAGIAPASVSGYVIAQAIGGLIAIVTLRTLYPNVTPADAATVLYVPRRRRPRPRGSGSRVSLLNRLTHFCPRARFFSSGTRSSQRDRRRTDRRRPR